MTRQTSALSIRWKLVIVTLATCAVAQLFAGVILTIYDNQAFRSQKSHEVFDEAAILASSVTASLAFSDAKSTQEYLDALKANPEVEAAGVYDSDGALFASYTRNGTATRPVPRKPKPFGQYFENSCLTVFVPVTEDKNLFGTVYLRAAIEPIGSRLLRYTGILFAALIGSLLIAVPISMRLNRSVSDPIREIAAAAARITTGDLSLDLEVTERADEIGLLMNAFRQMVAGLREMTGELERRVTQRTAQLEAANKELEAFSYSISHDLRAPLRAIDGFSLMIEEDYGATLDAEGKRLLSIVRSSANKMGNLIDDLLAFSKLGRQSINLVPTDMTALAQEVWEELQSGPSSVPCTCHILQLPVAPADRALVKQVWINLLSNAVKYSGTREHPAIEVDAEESDREITYRIRDNGVGFDMKYYNKLFGVFQRLHAATEFQGTGVGLAIVHRVVVRHGGRVWAEGKVGEGATFFFSLPKERAE